MTQRLYISKLVPDTLMPPPAQRPAWLEIIGSNVPVIGQATEGQKYNFWIGQLDTDATQHAALIADPRVRFVSQPLLAATLNNLTVAQRNAVQEVFQTYLGFDPTIFNFTNAKVKDVLYYIVGRCLWQPIRQADEAV